MNVLLITLDQFRHDCLSVAGHPVVRTPALDELAHHGVRLGRHYSQAAPCAPGRAALYTGTYQMNNRVVANGTPLDPRLDNVAKAARRAGYRPVLFGYTDQSIDPRQASGPDDPRLQAYTNVLPGFEPVLHLPDDHQPWLDWLTEHGFTDLGDGYAELAREPERPARYSVSAFLTDHFLDWLDHPAGGAGGRPWFAHLSYLRPHPPYAAAGHFATMYDPTAIDLPTPPPPDGVRHPIHDVMRSIVGAPDEPAEMRRLMAQYYGMVSEVDAQLTRVWSALRERDLWDDTFVVVTADHGEQLGDQGLLEKLGYFEESYHIVGIVRDPRHPDAHGSTVDAFTENVDVFPTLCEVMGIAVPAQCDGLPLTPFLRGDTPPWWRGEAHWEYDWREVFIRHGEHHWPWDRRLEQQHLAVVRDEHGAYVQFGDGSWLCFDLAADPTWRTTIEDPAVVLRYAQEMLLWRSRHTDRTFTDMLVDRGVVGRPPDPEMQIAVPLP